MKKLKFKIGDKVTLVSKEEVDFEITNWIENIDEKTANIGDEFIVKRFHEIEKGIRSNPWIDLDGLFFTHPAEKFRLSKYVERVKWKEVDGSTLRRGDIVKTTQFDSFKYIVISKDNDTVKLIPAAPISITRPDGYFEEEEEFVVCFSPSGSFYKLLNLREL